MTFRVTLTVTVTVMVMVTLTLTVRAAATPGSTLLPPADGRASFPSATTA